MTLPLVKIVSGGQTGADQAGLRAGHALGLQTGGWAPRGWQTQDGPAPWLADFGLVERGDGYGERTDANVLDSDATVRFACYFSSPGEIRTLRATVKYKKPRFDVPVNRLPLDIALEHLWLKKRDFVAFLVEHVEHRVAVLNIAGNSERTAPGIGAVVERFLVDALRPALR